MDDHDINTKTSEKEYNAALAAADTSLEIYSDEYSADCLILQFEKHEVYVCQEEKEQEKDG